MVARAQICDRCESRPSEVRIKVNLTAASGAKVGELTYWFCRPCVRAARSRDRAPCATHRCGGAAVRTIPVAVHGGPTRRFGYCLTCADELGRALGWPHEYWPQT